MKTVPEALATVLEHFPPLQRERVGLVDALHRVTAHAIHARYDCPAFDNSAMDGYALRAQDVTAPGTCLPLQGESRAGGPPSAPLCPGSAMRIFTGAMLPQGADTVVMQENTERDGDQVRFTQSVQPGANIRRRASDLAAGAITVPMGSALGPGEIAMLASQDHASVDVVRRPFVAILSSGDELRDIGAPPEPGSVVNSNAYALAAQVRRAGGVPWILPPAPDELERATASVREALTADVVLCSGGVSVGDYDVMRSAFAHAGVDLSFWKVAMKPGKPLSFGVHGRTPVVGLPGNPVSAFVAFELFVRPALRSMQGDLRPHLPRMQVLLSKAHRHSPGRLELARARLRREDGNWIAELASRQGSGSLPHLVGVDALVLLPAEQESFEAGAPVDALWLA